MGPYTLAMGRNRNTKLDTRVIEEAKWYLGGYSIRDLGVKFGIGKSVIHVDLCYKLPWIDKELNKQVRMRCLKNIHKRR